MKLYSVTPAVCFDVELQLKEFFANNDPQQTCPQINWATYKASVSGILIQLVSHYTKHSKALIHQKESELTALLKDHKQNPSLDLRGKIDTARLELNLR